MSGRRWSAVGVRFTLTDGGQWESVAAVDCPRCAVGVRLIRDAADAGRWAVHCARCGLAAPATR